MLVFWVVLFILYCHNSRCCARLFCSVWRRRFWRRVAQRRDGNWDRHEILHHNNVKTRCFHFEILFFAPFSLSLWFGWLYILLVWFRSFCISRMTGEINKVVCLSVVFVHFAILQIAIYKYF